ncbi:MAG: signal peptidase II [Planctomycetota bacterium]
MTVSHAPAPKSRALWALLAVVLLVGLDLWSKATVMPFLEARMTEFAAFHPGSPPEPELVRDAHGHERYPVMGNWLAWMYNLNYGAAFGRGGGMQKILVPGRMLAILIVGWLVLRAPRGRGVYVSALVLVLAGALGNLYDNLFYKPLVPNPDKPFGPVRDFIDVYFGVWDWHFATFNVADACISVGVGLLLLSTMLAPKEAPHRETVPGEQNPS